MKSKAWFASLILMIAALSTAACSQKQNTIQLITVMNPAVANKMVDRLPLAPRLDAIEGKTIYLVDIGWGGPQAAPSVYQ